MGDVAHLPRFFLGSLRLRSYLSSQFCGPGAEPGCGSSSPTLLLHGLPYRTRGTAFAASRLLGWAKTTRRPRESPRYGAGCTSAITAGCIPARQSTSEECTACPTAENSKERLPVGRS